MTKSQGRGNRTKQTARHDRRYPEKRRAYNAIQYALRRKVVIKPFKCELCEREGLVVGHHDDYKQALKVKWICWKCHNDIHKEDK